VSITDKYRVEEPQYLWYCGTKKYRKGDGTGTVKKWYRGAAVVPWYRATLVSTTRDDLSLSLNTLICLQQGPQQQDACLLRICSTNTVLFFVNWTYFGYSRSELKMNWKKLVQGQVIYHLNRHSELYKNIP